jgi:Tfp pilus assembly protein PilF
MMNTNSIFVADSGGDWWSRPLIRRLAVALLLVGIAAVFIPHIDNGFVYDDHAQIESNEWLRSDGSWFRPFQTDVWEGLGGDDDRRLSYYRPLFTVVNRILYRAGNGSPRIFHSTSVALHLVSVWLVWLVLTQVGWGWRSAYAAACLFAFHPLVGDVVFWAGCLSEQLMLVGFLSAIGLTFSARAQVGTKRIAFQVLSVIFACMAFLSKETSLVLAPLLFIDAWAGTASERGRRLLATVPLWIATAGYGLIRMMLFESSGLGGFYPTVLWSISRSGLVLLWDLQRLVLPYPLTLFHYPSAWWGSAFAGAVGALALLSIAVAGLWVLLKRPPWLVWAAWIILPLIPPLTQLFFVRQTGVIIADRYLLLSLVPWCAVLVGVARAGLNRFGSLANRQLVGTVALVLVCVTGGVILSAYGATFENDEAVFSHASRHDPGNPIVLGWLAELRMKQGRHREAIPLLEQAIAREPGLVIHHLNLGITMSRLGRRAEAIEAFRVAVAINEGFPDAHLLLANSLRDSGEITEAARHYEVALNLDPGNISAQVNLGSVHYLEGDVPGAIAYWESALASSPDHVDLLFNLGLAHRTLENHERSKEYLRRFLARADDSYAAQKESARRWMREASGPS